MPDRDWGGLIFGSILILIGFGWILGNVYGFNFWSLFSTYWPVIFIVIGLIMILKHWRKN